MQTLRSVLECQRDFSSEDVSAFVTITGDLNPIHTDGSAAKASGMPSKTSIFIHFMVV